MNSNLSAIVTVIFRTAAVIIILRAIYALVVSLIVGISGFQFVFLGGLVLPVIAALCLWFLAKPVGRLVTKDLP